MPKGTPPYQESLSPRIQAMNTGVVTAPVGESAQPRKRGRKPGPLSRSAREAQRKLNHSIIEKARRTKINEALAALRQLVPSDSARRLTNTQPSKDNGNSSSDDELDDDEGEDEGNGAEYRTSRRKSDAAPTKTKKKEEKEFKLEILERTVTYLQDLTARYDDLQKRHEQLKSSGPCHCSARSEQSGAESVSRKRSRSESTGSLGNIDSNDNGSPLGERPSKRHEPLPPISSWMPISPELPRSPVSTRSPTAKHGAVTPPLGAHLPTPPSSTLFQPTVSPLITFPPSSSSSSSSKAIHIPSLSLGPRASDKYRRSSASLSPSTFDAAMRGSSGRTSGAVTPTQRLAHAERRNASPTSPHTPEDETAASLLLTMRLQQRSPTTLMGHKSNISPLTSGKIRTSPISGTRARSSSSASGHTTSPSSPSSFMLPPPGMVYPSINRSGADGRESFGQRLPHNMHHIIETPGSLLGLTGHRNLPGF